MMSGIFGNGSDEIERLDAHNQIINAVTGAKHLDSGIPISGNVTHTQKLSFLSAFDNSVNEVVVGKVFISGPPTIKYEGSIYNEPPKTKSIFSDIKTNPTFEVGYARRSVFDIKEVAKEAPKPAPLKPATSIFDGAAIMRKPIDPKTNNFKVFDDGVVRVRLIKDIGDLIKIDPKASEYALKEAYELINQVNVINLTSKDIILWGIEIQKAYSALLEEKMKLLQNPTIEDCKTYINQIVQILQELDPRTVVQKRSIFNVFSKKPATFFNDKYEDLKKKISHMDQVSPALYMLKDQVDAIDKKFIGLLEKIDIFILSATFISSHAESPIREFFEQRAANLLATKLALLGEQTGIKNLVAQILTNLSEAIENTLRTEIPIWYSNYTKLLTMKIVDANPSLINEIVDQQQKIVQLISIKHV